MHFFYIETHQSTCAVTESMMDNSVLSKGFLLLVHFSFFIAIQHNESNCCTAWFLQSQTVACSS